MSKLNINENKTWMKNFKDVKQIIFSITYLSLKVYAIYR